MKKILFVLALTFPLYAQSINMPEMPTITSIPDISMPVIGGSFYTPSVPGYYSGSTGNTTTATTSTTNTTTSSTTGTSTSSSSATNLNLLTSLLYGGDYLTATDLNSLSSSGTLSSIAGLSSLGGYTDTSNTLVLTQILEAINELKEDKLQKSDSQTKTVSINGEHISSILRFKINGYDMMSSLTDVYFSEPEADGSFLLTIDRTYTADRKTYLETAYFLFHAGTSDATHSYSVEGSVSQNIENKNSLVYRMCNGGALKAVKTGNLVVLNGTQNGVTMDLLLDIGK